jgi:hypothetical protein
MGLKKQSADKAKKKTSKEGLADLILLRAQFTR